MKKKYLVLELFVFLSFISVNEALTFTSGAPAGSSGSPSGTSCAKSGCHSGGSQTTETITISSTIPSTGFEENTNYSFTIDANDGGTGISEMGFMASIESSAGDEGAITITDASRTQLSSGEVTHTGSGVSASGGQNSWSFDWNSGTAPVGTTVYVAVNFSNDNGTTNGDVIVTENLVLDRSNISIEEFEKVNFSVYPNPAQDYITLASDHKLEGDLTIVDMNGRVVKTVDKSSRLDAKHWYIDVKELASGNYFVKDAKASTAIFKKL